MIDAAGGQCLLDMRVRPGGSHHMKLVVLRHAGLPDRDVAFLGGIDLCHGRRDDAALRSYAVPQLSAWTRAWTRAWASVPYRLIFDPDGRPLSWRRVGRF